MAMGVVMHVPYGVVLFNFRTDADVIEKTFFYQIWIEKDEHNPLPSLQYLIEQSFLTGNLRLEEVSGRH